MKYKLNIHFVGTNFEGWQSQPSGNTVQDHIEKALTKEKNKTKNITNISQKNYEKEKEQSVKAIALIRAYRIRGHLIANLDPLNMMERRLVHTKIELIGFMIIFL